MPRTHLVVLDQAQLQDAVTWEGWGTSLAWFAVALGSSRALTEHISTLLFSKDPAKGLGMNIVRYNIGGACPDQVGDYRTGAAVPCFRRPDGSFNWNADSSQLALLLEAAQLGADTFEAFVNSPPWFWTSSGSSRGHQLPLANNLKKQHIADFAAFCAEVVDHFAREHGIVFSSLSPFNEPSSPAWCLRMSNRQEGCYFSRSRAVKVLHALAQQPALHAHGTQLVAFEQFCLRDTLSDLNHMPKDLWPELHRINLHTYTSKHFLPSVVKPYVVWQDNALWRRSVRKLAQKHRKKIWVSEFGSGRGAIAVAMQVIRDIAQLRPSAWVYWQAVEAPGVGWGLLEVPLEGHADAATAPAVAVDAAAAPGSHAAATPAADGTGSNGPQDTAAASVDHPAEATVSCSTDDLQQPACQILLHPNYYALQFIMQCIPVGAAVYRVKKLGRSGVLVQHSQQHWVLLYVNTNKKKTQVLQVDAASLFTGSAPAGSQGHAKYNHQQAALSTAAQANAPAAVTAKGAPAVPTTYCGDRGDSASNQPSDQRTGVELRISQLDVGQLQVVPWKPDSVVTPRAGLRSGQQKLLVLTSVHGTDWPISVDVCSQSLCRIDILLM